MPQTVKAVIARSKGADVELVDIVVPDPGPGEAVVAVQACGVCHTDLHYREGGITDDFPFLLGHEAAGVVESVGDGVTNVAPGDFVILNWRAVCGECRACKKGVPWYCFATHNATQKMTLEDGTELTPALGIGAFAEKTLVAAGQCTKVEQADPAAVGLLGCGVMAGFGAAVNTGAIQRGESIAVIGCGGVGDAAIAGAHVAGATTIIAVDVDDAKLETAKKFGATHTINSRTEDVVAKVKELTGGFGADVVVEAVGRPETYEQAFFARDLAGRVVLVGVPSPGATVELPLIEIFGRGGSLKSSWYGDCLPSRDFPMLVDLYRQGRFDLDAFVSERIGLGDVEAAFDKMREGAVLRSVVELEAAK
ncbi:S-(hydroxymethyl)mycothiol dehydrogenase [Calidifontibacter sp. DB0510]|uniref:S-(Hydroxymethyl)mycothiol dehydrogenase n=1 Tax=Metallococcus carri TaxID=1656884 RepID=A0A967EEC2_9MICO|nr:S-(hydroxymethyl)mycothiol dehydrogenase [Metallococcus carri]NHN55531.1 S-(hydroxymethyl)mycothiol dehydrogenase [Metallococcus carri]NOP38285.1 S-(hydroxymethyl)mycothiol dehydrogenase [Calidifontibacter sp. DB2511S]